MHTGAGASSGRSWQPATHSGCPRWWYGPGYLSCLPGNQVGFGSSAGARAQALPVRDVCVPRGILSAVPNVHPFTLLRETFPFHLPLTNQRKLHGAFSSSRVMPFPQSASSFHSLFFLLNAHCYLNIWYLSLTHLLSVFSTDNFAYFLYPASGIEVWHLNSSH